MSSASLFVYDDTGRAIHLDQLLKQAERLLLIFTRHFTCRTAKMQLLEMNTVIAYYRWKCAVENIPDERRVRFVAIALGPWEQLKTFRRSMGFMGEVYTVPCGARSNVFSHFGFHRSRNKVIFGYLKARLNDARMRGIKSGGYGVHVRGFFTKKAVNIVLKVFYHVENFVRVMVQILLDPDMSLLQDLIGPFISVHPLDNWQLGGFILIESGCQKTFRFTAQEYGDMPEKDTIWKALCKSDENFPLRGTTSTIPKYPKRAHSIWRQYTLGSGIASGNFGCVYHCKARSSCVSSVHGFREDEDLTMKIVNKPAATFPFNRKGMTKEQIVAILQMAMMNRHPHVVRYFDFLEDNAKGYIVMEYLKGPELLELLNCMNKVTEELAWKLTVQMSSALCFLHSNGVVHRDIKPENFKFSELEQEDDGSINFGALKLLDLGLCTPPVRYMDSEPDRIVAEDVCGTAFYMAPEMLRKRSFSEKVDTWGVGVILYMLFKGEYPFDVNSLEDRIVSDDFTGETWQALSPECVDFQKRLLALDPSMRLSSAECFAHPWIKEASWAPKRAAVHYCREVIFDCEKPTQLSRRVGSFISLGNEKCWREGSVLQKMMSV
eukprot:GEMP01009862.1.p1 GENE.GEMP01009862.1~~GEMP01009862.1.p1  ORF type:complete len:605 (+),score=66.72 GEMP01009862.1:53-1867(+)